MMKVQIETSTTTNKMMTEQKDMTNQLMEFNKEQANIMNKFITEEAKKWEEKKILDALQEYWNTNDGIRKLLKEISISRYINTKNEDGNTLLHFAVSVPYTDMVKTLLKHPNIDVEIKNDYGATALRQANRRWYTEIVKMITDHIDNKKK